MAKRTKAKKKDRAAPRCPPPPPAPEELPDVPLQVVFAEELDATPEQEASLSTDSSPNK